MKERPILFSGAMVRAILSGQKTVTRRVVKPQPDFLGSMADPTTPFKTLGAGLHGQIVCPYGQPGDRLWVRESLRFDPEYGHYYAAGGRHGETVYLCSLFDDEDKQTGPSYDGLLPERSVPSIHLHRRYSRILLEVTAVRVERLQDITEQQARAEGVKGEPCDHARQACADIGCWGSTAKGAFGFLWEALNGSGSWADNPWVWVVEFKRVTT